MQPTTQARVVVYGRVQGVFFRMETQREARRCEVAGWVKNRRDGTVEALFQGEQPHVTAMVAWCHHGPAGARVDKVDVSWQVPGEALSGFDIAY
jgi:acylphosphatase